MYQLSIMDTTPFLDIQLTNNVKKFVMFFGKYLLNKIKKCLKRLLEHHLTDYDPSENVDAPLLDNESWKILDDFVDLCNFRDEESLNGKLFNLVYGLMKEAIAERNFGVHRLSNVQILKSGASFTVMSYKLLKGLLSLIVWKAFLITSFNDFITSLLEGHRQPNNRG